MRLLVSFAIFALMAGARAQTQVPREGVVSRAMSTAMAVHKEIDFWWPLNGNPFLAPSKSAATQALRTAIGAIEDQTVQIERLRAAASMVAIDSPGYVLTLKRERELREPLKRLREASVFARLRDSVAALREEFGDPAAEIRQIEALSRAIDTPAKEPGKSIHLVQASGVFPDIPENHRAFEALAALKATGVMVGAPNGHRNMPPTLADLVQGFRAAEQGLRLVFEQEYWSRLDAVGIADLLSATAQATSFLQGSNRPEFHSMRYTWQRDLNRLAWSAYAASSTHDVSVPRWARSAVTAMRLNGIIVGSPRQR